nr:hypothetical protein [Roseivivax marinus]
MEWPKRRGSCFDRQFGDPEPGAVQQCGREAVQVAARLAEARGQCRGLAEVAPEGDEPHRRATPRQLGGDLSAAIGAAVVHQDDLEAFAGVVQHGRDAVDQRRQRVAFVQEGDHDAHEPRRGLSAQEARCEPGVHRSAPARGGKTLARSIISCPRLLSKSTYDLVVVSDFFRIQE